MGDRSRLRLWPAVTLVVLLWTLSTLPALVEETSVALLMTSFFGAFACAFGIAIWWLAGSRAAWRKKLLGFAGLVAIFGVTWLVAHPSIRGFPLVGSAMPWGMSAFVAGLVAARWIRPARPLAVGLLAACLGFGYWTLVRMDGVRGDLRAERSYRWQETAEDRYLASRDEGVAQATVAEAVGGVEWPGFRGPGRDGVVPGLTLGEDWTARPPRELWRIPVGPGWSSFAVAGRHLFTQEQRGELEAVVALDAETGAEIWAREYSSRFYEAMGGAGPRATPTLVDGMLFTLGGEGLLHRLDPATGEVVWQADLRQDAGREPPIWGFASSPLVVDGSVVVHAGGEGDRGVLAYDAETGKLRWGAPSGGHSYSSPQLSDVAGGPSVLVVSDTGVTLLDPGDGSVRLHHEWPFNNYRVLQPLVVDDSTLLMSTGFGVGTRRLDLRLAGGSLEAEERWTTSALKPDFNDYTAHEGNLYGFDPNILVSVDLETGERRWKGGRYGHGQLLLLPEADQLLVVTETGDVVLVRATPERLDELARIEALRGKTWNHPALVGDRLYLRNGEEAMALSMPLG